MCIIYYYQAHIMYVTGFVKTSVCDQRIIHAMCFLVPHVKKCQVQICHIHVKEPFF